VSRGAASALDGEESGRRTLRIGLTGPIGCGKSTIASWLGEAGAIVIDADRVARQVTQPGGPVHDSVIEAFGPDLRLPDGSLDRASLGRIVFADPKALRLLEAIVHPAVRPVILEEIAAAERAGAPAVVIEAIKLVEGGLAALCDEVWLVTCSPAEQLARVRARASTRGEDPGDAEGRVGAQAGIAQRVGPAATRVIDTSGEMAPVRRAVYAAWREVVAGSSRI